MKTKREALCAAAENWQRTEAPRRRRRRRRRVRFSPKHQVIGTADAMDRRGSAPNLFECDACGRRIHAGLKGFDLYAKCRWCDYDLCLECVSNADEVRRRGARPRCRSHPHPLVLVDRNRDDLRPEKSAQ